MIVYFSGTGNSRYVAEMLADLTCDTAVDAGRMIKNGEKAELCSDKPYVFVSPVYVSAPPMLFLDFIRNASLSGSKKAYFVMTCASGMGAAPVYCGELCSEKGLVYMGTKQVAMPQNYLILFKMNTPERAREIIAEAEPDIKLIADRISGASPFNEPEPKGWEKWSTELVLAPYYKWFMGAKDFYVTGACIGCGKCASSCVLNNIRLVNGRPVWGESCTHCMACINLCPKTAIEYGSKTPGKQRHKCPKYVSKQP